MENLKRKYCAQKDLKRVDQWACDIIDRSDKQCLDIKTKLWLLSKHW